MQKVFPYHNIILLNFESKTVSELFYSSLLHNGYSGAMIIVVMTTMTYGDDKILTYMSLHSCFGTIHQCLLYPVGHSVHCITLVGSVNREIPVCHIAIFIKQYLLLCCTHASWLWQGLLLNVWMSGNKTATVSWPDPAVFAEVRLFWVNIFSLNAVTLLRIMFAEILYFRIQ